MLRGFANRVAGDLVEDHPVHRHLRLEHLEQVPRDGLALAVLVSREVELVDAGERGLQLRDLLALVRVDDVERLETVVDVDAEAGPGFLLVFGRDVAADVGRSRM